MNKQYHNPFWDSTLSTEERIQYLLGEMKLKEKFTFLSTRHPALERLGIPAFSFGGEAAHGVEARNDQKDSRKANTTTSFTQPVGMSASWDTELIEQVGTIVGREARALFNRYGEGGLSRWAPTVDMERDPRWGRTEEGYGEDPLLTGKMASAYIRGMQGKDPKYLQMAASIKHFYANNVENGRLWKSSSIDPRNKYEYYLEPFRRTVTEGRAEGMMTAYNEINGIPAILNHEVKELVKEKWGLPGHVVCDGGDMTQTVEYHHYYQSHAQTVAEALKAGVDCFTDDPGIVCQAVREAYENHLITEMDIDRALKNSFSTKLRLGIYDEEEKNPYAKLKEEDLNTDEAASLSRKMAQESAVLLKNTDGFLPLNKTDDVVLIGPVGDAWFQDWYGGDPPYRVSLKGGMENLLKRKVPFENGLPRIILRYREAYVGIGDERKLIMTDDRQQAAVFEINDWGWGSATLYVPALKKYVSLYDDGSIRADKDAAFGWFVKESFRIEEKAGETYLFGWDGCGIFGDTELRAGKQEEAAAFCMETVKDGMSEAVKLAERSGKVIVALGCNPMINSKEEIDRTDLILPPCQEKLLKEIYRVNPNTVLMLFTNYPYAVNWEQENLPAILQMATGSQEMGNGAADLLFGEANPAGRLPLTWYRSIADLPDMDDYDIIHGRRTYQYFDKEVLYPFGHGLSYTEFVYEELKAVRRDEILKISVNIKNTGCRVGDEVVQVYGKRLSESRIKYPIKRLIGFKRIKQIMPGEKRKVEFEIPCRELEVYDVISRRRLLEGGEYLITVGELQYPLAIAGEKIAHRNTFASTRADHYDEYENIALGHAGGGTAYVAAADKMKKARLVYRDFAWTGQEKCLTLCLRSREKGNISVRLSSQENEKIDSGIALWQGRQKDFGKVTLPLEHMAGGKDKKRLILELEGDIEIESFVFENKEDPTYYTFSDKIGKIPYGGDYNPEQWPEEVWKEDMRLFKLAGIDCVTLNVFSWAALQPSEETYCFDKLDKIMEMIRENGLKVILATSTAAHPAWMAKKYPEVLRTGFNGIKRKFGDRHNSCPNSPVFRKYSARLAGKLAERYRKHENIIAFHISNEYGGECYCENCERAFRAWLKEKYDAIEKLNCVWNTAFWGHTFYDWDEIVVPDLRSEHFERERTTFQGISLDYRRFFSDSLLDCFLLEYEALKKYRPEIPVTTNMMGFYKPLDYQKWAQHLDFVSWDNYPANEDPPFAAAMSHDLMRGLKKGAPFVLMEQTPSVTNWLSYNALKRPGVMRLWSYQAIAHGSDSVLFFQMRRSIGACEKYHGAVIDHVGHEYTRVFREVKALGKELEKLGDILPGTRVSARAAILVDWDNWWALEYSAGPSCDLKYLDEIKRYYQAFYEKNIPVDLISVWDPLENYSLVIAPILYMVKEGYGEKLESFVKDGGCLVTTFFSGLVNEHDLVAEGGYPGRLREVLGIWVEETDALPRGMKNSFHWNEGEYDCELLCDILYTERAQALAFYEKDFYAGAPVLTRNRYGAGSAYYVASRGDRNFYKDFIGWLAGNVGIQPLWEEIPEVEISERRNKDHRYLFFLNHKEKEIEIRALESGKSLLDGKIYRIGEKFEIEAKGVMILQIS